MLSIDIIFDLNDRTDLLVKVVDFCFGLLDFLPDRVAEFVCSRLYRLDPVGMARMPLMPLILTVVANALSTFAAFFAS